MRTLLGLQPPLEGKIVFGDGLEQNEIGYLPQQTAVQKDFPASVREIILSGCQNKCGIRPFYSRKEKQVASEMMEKLQITHISNKCFRELQVGSSKECYLRGLCVQQVKFFCLMSLLQVLIQKRQKKCINYQ